MLKIHDSMEKSMSELALWFGYRLVFRIW